MDKGCIDIIRIELRGCAYLSIACYDCIAFAVS